MIASKSVFVNLSSLFFFYRNRRRSQGMLQGSCDIILVLGQARGVEKTKEEVLA
jgi:hypothetical protein